MTIDLYQLGRNEARIEDLSADELRISQEPYVQGYISALCEMATTSANVFECIAKLEILQGKYNGVPVANQLINQQLAYLRRRLV